MNAQKTFGIGLLAFSLAITVTGTSTEARDNKSQTSPDFKKLMVDEARAIDTLNMKNGAPFHAKDSENVFFDIAPLKYNGWAEYEEGTQKLMSQWSSMKCTINDDGRTHQQGILAWGTATWHCAIVQRDEPVN
jgi:ketosteroid isomerase-like protein